MSIPYRTSETPDRLQRVWASPFQGGLQRDVVPMQGDPRYGTWSHESVDGFALSPSLLARTRRLSPLKGGRLFPWFLDDG